MVSDKKFFSMFSLFKSMKTCDPLVWYPIWPQGHKLSKIGRCLLGDATYKISQHKALWFQTRRFFMFPYISLCITCDPGAGPLDDATYQMSRLWCVVTDKKIF